MNNTQDKQKEQTQYEINKETLSRDERIKYEQGLILSGDKEKLHKYMDGLIRSVMVTLEKKKYITTIPIDEKMREILHEKVDKAAFLYKKNIKKSGIYLFSVYYLYFVNEILDETDE